jgi:hypothetical protein
VKGISSATFGFSLARFAWVEVPSIDSPGGLKKRKECAVLHKYYNSL